MTFIYGRPVRSDEFIGRDSELLTIFNRLRNRESTAITGEPHIGKSSLLLQIEDRKVQERYLLDDAKKLVTTFIDLHLKSRAYTPFDFWNDALKPLQDKPGHSSTAIKLNEAKEENYENTFLRNLFQHISEKGQVLVLLLDEFDILLSHPNFSDYSFFSGLRSLSTITGGIAYVTSSRLTLAELNAKGDKLLAGNVDTSPFFNNFIDLKLRPFSSEIVTKLFQRTPDLFTGEEILFMRQVAGRHPFLLQAMAATLNEVLKTENDRQIQASEMFYQRIGFHFDTLWKSLDDKARTTAVILCLIDLGGRSAGSNFSYGEIEDVEAFDRELRNLADLGLAEKIKDGWQLDFKHGLLWRGEQWTIGAQVFTWWVRDVVISKSRKLEGYDDWLAEKRYRVILTEGQWNTLGNLVRKAPEFLNSSIGSLAKTILQGIMGTK